MKASTIPHTKAVESRTTSVAQSPEAAQSSHGIERIDLIRILIVIAAAAAVWFHIWEPIRYFSLIGVVAMVFGGYPIFREAIDDILERRMTMELSMTIALGAALVIGEMFTALVITAFVLAAEVLEGLTMGQGRRAIRDLLDFLPGTASLVPHNGIFETLTAALREGDLVLARPGSRIPVDGVVASGHSFVDESAITGEPMPAEKMEGKNVFAGSINQSGVLQIRVKRIGRDTSFGKIIEAVERAEKSRAPIQKTADRLAGYLVYFALSAAILTFLITRNIRSTISVIIVAGACGVAAGTPLAILGAIGRAARLGSIIKGGLFLEKLAAVNVVLLDKTGTLTYGAPEVVEITPHNGISQNDVLQIAAIAEMHSEHPFGKAILKRAVSEKLDITLPQKFEYEPGSGVRAFSDGIETLIGNRQWIVDNGLSVNPASTSEGSEVFVARDGISVGSILIADQVRPEAADAVRDLHSMKIQTVLLTGDSQAASNHVAEELRVQKVYSALLPDQKVQKVREMIAKGSTVAMLGDGINDAPALAEADVGIAMGSGTDVARESADVVLIGNDLSKFVATIRIARKCRTVIMQNFYGTLIVDTVGIGMAAVGLLNPLIAAFIHVSSELLFILNSTRLLAPKAET
jgi:heavy metal translocating P-type ATPase